MIDLLKSITIGPWRLVAIILTGMVFISLLAYPESIWQVNIDQFKKEVLLSPDTSSFWILTIVVTVFAILEYILLLIRRLYDAIQYLVWKSFERNQLAQQFYSLGSNSFGDLKGQLSASCKSFAISGWLLNSYLPFEELGLLKILNKRNTNFTSNETHIVLFTEEVFRNRFYILEYISKTDDERKHERLASRMSTMKSLQIAIIGSMCTAVIGWMWTNSTTIEFLEYQNLVIGQHIRNDLFGSVITLILVLFAIGMLILILRFTATLIAEYIVRQREDRSKIE